MTVRSAVQARFSNHTFKSGYSSLGKRKKKKLKKKIHLPNFRAACEWWAWEMQRNRACIYSSHGDLSKGWWCQDFFLLPSWPLVGVVFYFLPSGALENIKFLSPWMLPRKMGSQDELPEVCEVQEPWAFWILECQWSTGSSNWKYRAHGQISIHYIH